MKCNICDRVMRKRKDKDAPGITHGGRGLCTTCYTKENRAGRLAKRVVNNTPTCMHCHRVMRPFKTKIADYPGTVPRYSKKVCWTCNQRINNATVNIVSTKPEVSVQDYLAVKRLVKNDLELLQVLGLDQFEEVSV